MVLTVVGELVLSLQAACDLACVVVRAAVRCELYSVGCLCFALQLVESIV